MIAEASLRRYQNNVLIGLVNSVADLQILNEKAWYRIPIENAPEGLIEGQFKFFAPYLSAKLRKTPHTAIERYYPIKEVKSQSRLELFGPIDIENHPEKANKVYLVLKLGDALELDFTISESKKVKRPLFHKTSHSKLKNGGSLDDLID